MLTWTKNSVDVSKYFQVEDTSLLEKPAGSSTCTFPEEHTLHFMSSGSSKMTRLEMSDGLLDADEALRAKRSS